MPALALPAFWAALGAGAMGAGAIYGANKQSQSTDKAADLKATSDAAALNLARQQEATRKQEYDQQQAQLKAQYDAQQALRAPYRAAGANALSALGNLLGVDFGQGYTGPTPSTPSTFGPTTPPGQTAVSGGPTPDQATRKATMAQFNAGAEAIQNQLAQSPAGTMPTGTPPPAPTTTGGPPAPAANPLDPGGIQAALTQQYSQLGVTPTGPGSGPTDIGYYAGKVAETGGLTAANINYWFGPNGRIASDLAKARGGASSTRSATTPGGTPGMPTIPGLPNPLNVPMLAPPLPGGIAAPGYSPVIPISGLMGRGPYQ